MYKFLRSSNNLQLHDIFSLQRWDLNLELTQLASKCKRSREELKPRSTEVKGNVSVSSLGELPPFMTENVPSFIVLASTFANVFICATGHSKLF